MLARVNTCLALIAVLLPCACSDAFTSEASGPDGGGAGGFDSSLPGVGLPTVGATCPGNNYGTGVLPANPVPHTETVNAIRHHFRRCVTQGTPPPASRWPRWRPPRRCARWGVSARW